MHFVLKKLELYLSVKSISLGFKVSIFSSRIYFYEFNILLPRKICLCCLAYKSFKNRERSLIASGSSPVRVI